MTVFFIFNTATQFSWGSELTTYLTGGMGGKRKVRDLTFQVIKSRSLVEKQTVMHAFNSTQFRRSEGEAERDIGSTCMIGPGLVVVVVEKIFRRRRRRHLGVDLTKLGLCIKI